MLITAGRYYWLCFLGLLSITEASYYLVWQSKDEIPKPHIHIPLGSKPTRRPKQLLGASVVTSVSSIKEHDPEAMKRRYEMEYHLNNGNISSAMAMEPRFYFYLYNEEGNLIREKLSIHDIQSLLLQETQIQGLKNRGWLFQEEDHETATPPSTTAAPTPQTPPSNEALKGVLDKIHDIIQDAKTKQQQQLDNTLVLSDQINVSQIPKSTTTTPPSLLREDILESKSGGGVHLYENRYHGLHDNEHPWVDFHKQDGLASLEAGLSESLSRTRPESHSYFPVHPQVYRNKVFKDFLSLDYETSPYDEENGSASIQMTSLESGSDLLGDEGNEVYLDDDGDHSENHDNVEHQHHGEEEHHGTKQHHGDDAHHDTRKHHGDEKHHGAEPKDSNHHHHSHDNTDHHDSHHATSEHHSHNTDKEPQELPRPPKGHLGLHNTTSGMNRNMKHFIDVNNELSLYLYSSLLQKAPSKKSNLIFSPLSSISTLSMIFLGARGKSSWQMNELLHLDEMISFNPHLLYKELMESIMSKGSAGFVKQLLVDKKEDPFIDFYKSRIQYFYKGHADQIDFTNISSEFKSRINALFRELSYSMGGDALQETHEIKSEPPMAVMGASLFNCELNKDALTSVEPSVVNFINLPSYGRRLVPTSGLSLRGKFQAGYDPKLDATSVQVPLEMPLNLSLLLLLPGKPGEFKVGGLSSLESKLNSTSWNGLLKNFLPLQKEAHLLLPRLEQESLINLNSTFTTMGSTEIFGQEANFVGINGGRDLRLSAFYEFAKLSLKDSFNMNNTNNTTSSSEYDFRFERQFLYVLRHDPTGLIVTIGRYLKPKHAL